MNPNPCGEKIKEQKQEQQEAMEVPSPLRKTKETRKWYVLRDFSKSTKEFSFNRYKKLGFTSYAPLVWQLVGQTVNKKRMKVPFIRDLFFVYATRKRLDPVVELDPDVTYRFVRGGYCKPMTVPTQEMKRFIHAVEHSKQVEYYKAEEIKPDMYGKPVRIVGGTLDGYEGMLLSVSGSAVKRLLVTLPGFFAAGVTIEDADYVELV